MLSFIFYCLLQTNILYTFILYISVFYVSYIQKAKIFSDHMQSLWIPEHPSEVRIQLLAKVPVR